MIKELLVSSVQKAILKQSPTQDSLKFAHPKVVEDEISKAYNQIMKTFYASNINLMNAELDFYAKKFKATLVKHEDGYNYINMPVRPVELKNNLGIRYVRPVTGKRSFVRTTEGELETLRELEVYCCSGDAYYFMDGNMIVFDFPRKEYEIVSQVYIKMLPVFSDFEDSDNIEFPTGEKTPTDMVLETMGFRPTDNTNDDVK